MTARWMTRWNPAVGLESSPPSATRFSRSEDRDQHIGAGHLLAAGGLHMNDRALDDALESGRGLGILAAIRDEVLQIGRSRPAHWRRSPPRGRRIAHE